MNHLRENIIIALDTQDKNQIIQWIKELSEVASIVKVGMEAYYSFGNDMIKTVKDHGLKIFLDLKLHDIPNTVERSCKTLGKLDVDMLNVHASGGLEMMKRALIGYREFGSGDLIAVTHLTSSTEAMIQNELHINTDMNNAVLNLAKLTKNAGLSGVVCSPLEIKLIKDNIQNFKTVTPGIRPTGSSRDDQKRIMTPKEAFIQGGDYIVIGRPITQALNIKEAFLKIAEDL